MIFFKEIESTLSEMSNDISTMIKTGRKLIDDGMIENREHIEQQMRHIDEMHDRYLETVYICSFHDKE